jgi:hypothetical protein
LRIGSFFVSKTGLTLVNPSTAKYLFLSGLFKEVVAHIGPILSFVDESGVKWRDTELQAGEWG